MQGLPQPDDYIQDMPGADDFITQFGSMPVAIYRSAPSGELLAANPALASLLGFETVAELMAATTTVDAMYVNPEERDRWMDLIGRRDVVNDFDVELRRPDGSTVWVRDTARAIRDDRGRVLHYDGSFVDVTDKIDAQRAKDDFIAIVSHELRNPIAVVLGLGHELANNYDSFSDDDRREMAEMIARQADDASWLIEDLLVAYRDDLSRVSVTSEEFDVGKEVERVLEVIEHPVEIVISDGSGQVIADSRRTRQILRNLVSNALRHGGDELRIQIGEVGDRTEVRVQDSGDPIPAAELDQIFKMFQRGSSPTHSKSVGLGLSVARRLARLMEGDLTYRSQDGWSTFVLSLPAG